MSHYDDKWQPDRSTPAQTETVSFAIATARLNAEITCRKAYDYVLQLLALRRHCCHCLGEPRADTLVQVPAYCSSYLRTKRPTVHCTLDLGTLV